MNTKTDQVIDIISNSLSIYNETLTKQSAGVWLASLMRFDIGDIKHAFNVYIQTSERGHFSPKPSDIVNTITGGNADVAKVAWSLVERSIRSIGGDRTVIFQDPLIHKVIYDLGGWAKVCGIETERDLSFFANDFENRYKGYMNRGVLPKYPNRLVGRAENSLRDHGLDWRSQLDLVGGLDECIAVFNGGVKPESISELAYNQSAGSLARAFVANKAKQEAEADSEKKAEEIGYYPQSNTQHIDSQQGA